jgi:hypothetical protein
MTPFLYAGDGGMVELFRVGFPGFSKVFLHRVLKNPHMVDPYAFLLPISFHLSVYNLRHIKKLILGELS